MKKIFFFLYALVGGFILVGLYFRFVDTKKPTTSIKIPFIGSQFSLQNSPTESLKGKIVSSSGEINWQSRVATESSRLTSNVQFQQGESIATGDTGNIKIQFGNGVEISLLPKTKVDIIQTLKDDIVFNQASGSATYKKMTTYPVSIRINHLLIETNGTVEISTSEDRIITVVATSKDSIAAFNNLLNESNVISIPENGRYIFNDDTRQGGLK